MSPFDGLSDFNRKIISAIAMAAVFGLAHAEDEAEMAKLTKPDMAEVGVGVGYVSGDSKDRSLWGQYNGLRNDDVPFLLDLDYVRRDDETATWTNIEGRNLGLNNRELRFQQQHQGNWKLYGEYSELVRYDPRTINTSLQGAESTNQTVTRLAVPGTGQDLDLQIKRQSLSLGGEKWITPSLMFEVAFKTEDKDGARQFGKGFTCPSGAAPSPTCTALAAGTNQWAILLLPEPINSTTRQVDAKLNYVGDKLALTAGYYGSFYLNDNDTINPTVSGNLNNPLGNPMAPALTAGLRGILQLPMALPPDNQAHQFSLLGNYAFTPTTRTTFKVAYTHATQHDDFASSGLTGAPPGVSNYGGELNTILAQLGLTARPLPKLSVNANVRYEDRKDESPLALYNIEGVNRFSNGTYSLKKTSGKLEGTYQLPASFRLTLGADYEGSDRGQFSSPECITPDPTDPTAPCIGDSIAGLSAVRAKTTEITYRAELRKSISETLTGAIGYSQSQRDGSDWLKPVALPGTGVVAVSDAAAYSRTGIFPAMFMDRKRKKARAQADWSPMDRLSVQLTAEYGEDTYTAPTEKGLSDTGVRLYGVDVTYALSEAWKVTGYYSYSQQTMHVSHSTGYIVDLIDDNDTAGIGIVGKATERFEMGADILYIADRNKYDQSLDGLASATNKTFLAQSGGLPDVTYRDLRFKFYGKYAVQKNGDIRLDVVHDRQKLDEWTWGYNGVPFLYSDNTTVSMQQNQNVTFAGVSYIFKWR